MIKITKQRTLPLPISIDYTNTYQRRLEHRFNCKHWSRGNPCEDCGFGLTKFYADLLKEYKIPARMRKR